MSDHAIQDESIRAAAEKVVHDWEDVERFLSTFAEVRREEAVASRRDFAADVLRVAALEHGKDVIGRMGEVARRKQAGGHAPDFWVLYHPFCQVLPDLSFEPAGLADALEPVLRAEANDLAGGGIYGAIKELAGRSRATADLLFNAFASRPDSPVASLAANALVGLAALDLREAHRRALALTHAAPKLLSRVGLGALSSFSYSEAEEDLLRATLQRFEELREQPNPETDDVLARAYGLLIDRAEEAPGAFVEMAGRSDPAVHAQVAFILFRRAESDRRQEWYRKALLCLARLPATQTGTLDDVDHCLALCAADEPEFATGFLEAFVTSRNYGKEEPDTELPEILDETFSTLRRSAHHALEVMITRWFASTDRRLHQAASDLVRHGHYGSPDSTSPIFQLSKPVLDSLDDQTLIWVLLRVLGYGHGGRLLAALVASAVRREPLIPAVAASIEEALSEYVLYNYPESAREYLTGALAGSDLPAIGKEVIQRALARSEAYLQALQALPRLKELRPPIRRLLPLRRAEQKFNNRIMEQAQKQSVFMSLVHHIPLKYGASFFTEMEGTFTEPTRLGELSHAFELPRGETIDPLGQQFLRIKWRSSGLEEKGEE